MGLEGLGIDGRRAEGFRDMGLSEKEALPGVLGWGMLESMLRGYVSRFVFRGLCLGGFFLWGFFFFSLGLFFFWCFGGFC